MGIKHITQVTTPNNPASPVSRDVWNEEHAVDETGLVIPAVTTEPTVPPAMNVRLFARERAGRTMLAQQSASGIDAWLQPHVGRSNVAAFSPHGTNALGGLGLTLVATGTATTPTFATSSVHAESNRLEFLATAASTTAVAGYRSNSIRWTRSFTAGRAGFLHISRFGPATGLANATRRLAAGLRNGGGASTDVQPSSLLNTIIAGYDAADANMQIMHNDGAGAATKIDTGIPRPTTDRTGYFDFVVFAPPGSASVFVSLRDVISGAQFDATLTTDLPAAGTFLNEFGYSSAGGTSSVAGISVFGLYTESDN